MTTLTVLPEPGWTTPRRPLVVSFDVIETLVTLDPVEDRLRAAGLPPGSLRVFFAQMLRDAFPQSLDAVDHLAQWGPTVLLSDGDVVFQPRKIERSGLFEAVERRVLIYIHKEQELDDIAQRFPAAHYVLVDDKVRILAAVKKVWGERLTTVFPRQGHYARDPQVETYPPPDVIIERIGDLLDYDLPALLQAARTEGRPSAHARR